MLALESRPILRGPEGPRIQGRLIRSQDTPERTAPVAAPSVCPVFRCMLGALHHNRGNRNQGGTMRAWSMALIAALLLPTTCMAGVVIHDGQPGIVANHSGYMLDHLGQCWYGGGHDWVRYSENDPPFPVADLRFWQDDFVITTANELWQLVAGEWISDGFWPGTSSTPDNRELGQPMTSVSPTPFSDSCHIAFSVVDTGPVTVRIYDAGGRIVRTVLEETLPPGDYAPTWDGLSNAGEVVPAGVYLSRIELPTGAVTERVIRIQ
ncbi:MAG: hypothetical protein GF355_17015 [Candidatus Eisenbacteria bacterium]|nr:hypothetical protein [Candidatus Eisenbacteria bacterium]